MDHNYAAGQDVKVLVKGQWLDAKINTVYDHSIHVEFTADVELDAACSFIPISDVGSKLIIHDAERQKKVPVVKIETSQLKVGQIVQYKLDQNWVPAEVTYVGGISKFINIEYEQHDGLKAFQQINECEYVGRIRFISSNELDNASSECKDKDADNDSQSAEAGEVNAMDTDTASTDAGGHESDNGLDATPANIDTDATYDSTAKIQDESNNDGHDPWYKRGYDATIGRGVTYVKNKVTSEPKPPPKKKPEWNQKAISDWSHKDVISWVDSMDSYAKYSSAFPKHINGAVLLKTEFDDLTLIIPKKMWRRRFMKQLELAKTKYATAEQLDPNEYELENKDEKNDDDEKAAGAEVNGVVGLHNLRNTCYMNTSIQILSQTPGITRYLQQRALLNKRGPYPMLNAWTDLCNIIYNKTKSRSYTGWNNYTCVSPAAIRAALKEMDYEFASGAQDDSSRSLGYILQGLDRDIEQEIMDQKKRKQSSGNVYKDEIAIYHGRELDKAEKDDFIEELKKDHNPENSILRKTFDGIEHSMVTCLECNKMYQVFSIFQMIDLALVSQEVTLTNINIICNDKYYKIPEISILNYCSADLLVYHAVEYLKNQDVKIKAYDTNIMVLEANGTIHDVNDRKLSDFKFKNASIFVLINAKTVLQNEEGRLLQINLKLDKTGKKSLVSSMQYNPYNAKAIKKLASAQIKSYHEQSKDDDEKYDYYAVYNEQVRSIKELKAEGFAGAVFNEDGINTLFVLQVSETTPKYCYDHTEYDEATEWDATTAYGKCTKLDALKRYQSDRIRHWEKCSKKKNFEKYKSRQRLELNRIKKTLDVLTAKRHIFVVVNQFMKNFTKSRYSMTAPRQLGGLDECLNEYVKARILDVVSGSYSYPCPCKSGSKSRWVKVQKKIVYTPPILLFHLDRYGKRMTNSATYNKSKSPKYHKGQKLKIKYQNGKSYTAVIENVNERGMNIKYLIDYEKEYIPKNQYCNKIPSYSRNTDYSHSYYNYGSNKFDHDIKYGNTLKFRLSETSTSVYELYGVSNHSGTTEGGHYTATVKCRTDGEWYNISDSHVSKAYSGSATSHPASATILAYVQI